MIEDTGWKGIDTITGGIENGELVVFTGNAGDGTTALAMNTVKDTLDADEGALYFTNDDPEAIANRIERLNNDATTLPKPGVVVNEVDESFMPSTESLAPPTNVQDCTLKVQIDHNLETGLVVDDPEVADLLISENKQAKDIDAFNEAMKSV